MEWVLIRKEYNSHNGRDAVHIAPRFASYTVFIDEPGMFVVNC